MRLIDADALRYKNLAEVNGRLTYVLTPEEINNAPTVEAVQMEQPTQSLISRYQHDFVSSPTEVISDEINKALEKGEIYKQGFEDARKRFERPQGKWIVDEDNDFFNSKKCSVCNNEAEWLDGGSQFLSNFCGNCGAKMEMREGAE